MSSEKPSADAILDTSLTSQAYIIHHMTTFPSASVKTVRHPSPAHRVALTSGCQIGYMDSTGCHQLAS
jgi:hypothetical protein